MSLTKRIYSPCFKCERRAIGCHAACEDYAQYKNEIRMNDDVFSNYATDGKVKNVLIGNLERRKRQRERW